jgi:2-methylcitrate dehydratase PrpD
MVKHGIGWGAMTGLAAAQLAVRGFTGIPSLFGLDQVQEWVADIGQTYIMADGLAWKGYACCAWDHAAMKGADELVKDHKIHPEQIDRVYVEAPHVTVRLGTTLPTTTEEAQFSLGWPLAALLVDGEVGPAQMLEHRFEDPQIRAMAERIEVVETEEMNTLYKRAERGDPQGRYAARVTITLKDGRILETGIVEGNINFPQQGWDQDRLEEKFRWLTQQVLDQAQVEELVDLVWRFDQVPDVHALTTLLT